MHLTAMNAPLRTAIFGGRISSSWSAPIAHSSTSTSTSGTTAASPAPAPRRRHSSSSSQKYQQQPWTPSKCTYEQKRGVSTKPVFKDVSCCRGTAPSRATSYHQPIITTALLAVIRSPASSFSTSARSASASSAPSSAQGSSSSTSNAGTSTDGPVSPALLDWNTFFGLRASRRRYSLISSIATALGTTSAGVTVLATQNLENLGAQLMGLDPIAILGLGTAAAGAVGWLAGPFLGNALWRIVNRKYRDAFTVKDKEFYDRIKRFRVDPSAQSFSNPVPDYYGEKINSVAGYRRWLKDQRAYNRKKRSFV